MELITRVLAGVIAAWIPIEATSKRAISGQELERRLTSGPLSRSCGRPSKFRRAKRDAPSYIYSDALVSICL
jgi:hypothetical protein